MKLKHGKKYEAEDGLVYRVRYIGECHFEDFDDPSGHVWSEDGEGYYELGDLIRRHYKKPKPAHKLDLKPGDVVKLVEWEDQAGCLIGERISVDIKGLPAQIGIYGLNDYPKGQRPLFRVVSRA